MNGLYEVTNGWMGESYVRVYVWAADEKQARELACVAYEREVRGGTPYRPETPEELERRVEDRVKNLEVTLLFRADAEPFSTVPSSDGWETGQ